MAITSIGYDGSVNESQWARMIPQVGSSQYGVVDASDWKVTAHATMDRGVSIAVGSGWGHGVLDTSDTVVSLQGASVSAGDRWDMVVMRRNWSGVGGTSTFVIVTGSPAKQLPTRNNNPGALDDQPIALIRFSAGQTAVQEIIDLRCWGRNGGLCARDDLALTYLKLPGAQIMINGIQWNCELDGNGTATWTTFRGGYIPVFGVGGALSGAPGANTQFLIQVGSTVQPADPNGYARITWPKPFPNGLLSLQLTNGDSSSSNGAMFPVEGNERFWGASGVGDRFSVVYTALTWNGSAYRPTPNLWHRINWLAIGW